MLRPRMAALAVLILSFMLFGCGDGFDCETSKPAPRIVHVVCYDADMNPARSYMVGDNLSVMVYAADPYRTVENLYLVLYYPWDSDEPWSGPHVTPVSPWQSGWPGPLPWLGLAVPYFFEEVVRFEGSAGDWRMKLWLENSEGNESDVFEIFITVDE